MPWAMLGEELQLGTNVCFPCAATSQGKGLCFPAVGGAAQRLPVLPASPLLHASSQLSEPAVVGEEGAGRASVLTGL